ncbi:GrpB family protein [Nocardioides sp. NPDC059952]
MFPRGRPVNIHIRQTGSPTARYALLFRDFLRAEQWAAETSWSP